MLKDNHFHIISVEIFSDGLSLEKNRSNELAVTVDFMPPQFEDNQLTHEDDLEATSEKVAFSYPIPIVHKLPNSIIEDLHR